MSRVRCTVEEIELEGDHGEVPSVQVTCSKCDHTTEAYGTHEQSIKRCLVTLREECQLGEENWYYVEDAEG